MSEPSVICLGDGDIPVYMEIADGNQSNKARFAQLCQEFKQQWTFDGLWVADGALYSADNLKTLEGLTWLTRVPLSIKETSILVDSTKNLTPSTVPGYSWASFSSDYGDVLQRWLLIESEKRRQSDLKQLTKKIEKYYSQAEKLFKQLSSTEFACATDALNAAQKLSSQMNLHQLSDLQVIEKPHYGKTGKPGKDDVPQRLSYHVTASIVPIDSEIEAQRLRCGRFILATNVLDSDQFSADDALRHNKVWNEDFVFSKTLFFLPLVFSLSLPNEWLPSD